MTAMAVEVLKWVENAYNIRLLIALKNIARVLLSCGDLPLNSLRFSIGEEHCLCACNRFWNRVTVFLCVDIFVN